MTATLKSRRMTVNEVHMNIIRNKEYLEERYGQDFEIVDDRLESIGVYLLPHYGHMVCLSFSLEKYRHQFHNDTGNLCAILHHFSRILNIREDGDYLHEISQYGKSVTSVWVDSPFGKQCVGIGSMFASEFILFDEFNEAEV
jgi:hypothetical protein